MRKPTLRALLIYGLSLLLTFVLDQAAKFVSRNEAKQNKNIVETVLTGATAAYQRFLTLGYRRPRAHYVRLVMLDQMKEPMGLMSNLCDKRVMYAKVIRSLVPTAPASIVIDATFGPDKCRAGDPGTAALVEAVQFAVRQDVPVTVGLKALTRGELPITPPNQAIPDDALVAQPSLNFDVNGSQVEFGHVRLNEDVRKIPLNWPTVFSIQDATSGISPTQVPSLAYMAACRYDSLLPVQPRLLQMLRSERHPFSSFIPEDQFPTIEALDLVCGKYNTPQNTNWTKCRAGEYAKAVLRGHIVLIGERTDPEFRDTEVGRVPGVVLQANYIESLLDDRYFLPVRTPIQILISFAVFGFVGFTFERQKRRPGLALLFSLIGMSVVLVASWVLLVLSARLAVVWVPGLFALIGKYLDNKLKGGVRESSNG